MEQQEHIVVVDDDYDIQTLLKEFLIKHHYQVSSAKNGTELNSLLDQDIALIILDIMLPDTNGLELCQQICSKSSVPIIMLTAVTDTVDRIIGLELGADDYLTKPFNPRELLARIKAILRRTREKKHDETMAVNNSQTQRSLLKFSGWILDTAIRRLISPDTIEVPLTGRGYDLLMVFLENPQKVLSRDQLLDILSNRCAEPFDRSIDVQVSRLRQKLGDDPKEPRLIKTIRTGGYLFASHVSRN